ncbi:MAG: hypothetical protein LBJ08_09940 [Bifidobacteriaceae bacterium]|nr:hypothetical protein [Bifidobacteriaceae bacterium]
MPGDDGGEQSDQEVGLDTFCGPAHSDSVLAADRLVGLDPDIEELGNCAFALRKRSRRGESNP